MHYNVTMRRVRATIVTVLQQ